MLFLLVCIPMTRLLSQPKTYWSSGGEMIFSLAEIKTNENSSESILRWSPFFNLQNMINADFSDHFGIFSGISLRNVGFILNDFKQIDAQGTETFVRKKFRTYSLGIPAGIKFGNLGKSFLYGGYELEMPFHFKEKTFVNGDKTAKITGWFSDRVVKLQHGLFVGVQLPYGTNLKFKYYVSAFLNRDFIDENGLKPYSKYESHVFYVSLSSYVFRNFDFEKPKLVPTVY